MQARTKSSDARSVSSARGRQLRPLSLIPCTARQLEVFLAAAEDCHFACTANRLGISQAAISSHIAALEQQLGEAVFVRKPGKKPILSSCGLALLGRARQDVAIADGASSAEANAQRNGAQTVRVGAGGHLLDDYIKRSLPQFHREHANVRIECRYVDAPGRCAELVRDGSVDLLVYTVRNPARYSLHAEVLRPVRFGLYAGRKLSSSTGASSSELSAAPFILPPEGSPACDLVQSALEAVGIRCRSVAAHVQFATVAKDLARLGEGIAALFDTMVAPDRDELSRVGVELPTMYRTMFRAKRSAADPAVQRVEAFLRETLSH